MAATQGVKIRSTHPALYRSIMTLSIMSVLLAVNFWTSTPAFDPLSIPRDLIGAIFFLLGVWQLVFLNVFHSLKMVRIGLAVSFSFMLFWGAANSQQSFTGRASFQLPIIYIILAVFQITLLFEPPVNPATSQEKP